MSHFEILDKFLLNLLNQNLIIQYKWGFKKMIHKF